VKKKTEQKTGGMKVESSFGWTGYTAVRVCNFEIKKKKKKKNLQDALLFKIEKAGLNKHDRRRNTGKVGNGTEKTKTKKAPFGLALL